MKNSNERSNELPALLSTPDCLISHPDSSGEYLVTDRSGYLRIGILYPSRRDDGYSIVASEDAIRDIGDAEVSRILEEAALALADWLGRGAGR